MGISINSAGSYFSYSILATKPKCDNKGLFNNSNFKKPEFEAKNPLNDDKNSRLSERIRGLSRSPSNSYVYQGHKEKDPNKVEFISSDFKNHTYTDTSQGKVNGYLNTKTETTTGSKTEKEAKKLNYNYKDVSSQILRAKNPLSAGQAVLKARRKVLELKRKIGKDGYDKDDLSAALNHAKAMERAARRKKKNLEMEELIEIESKRNGNYEEKGSDGATQLKIDEVENLKEKVSDEQSQLDEVITEEEFEAADTLSENLSLSGFSEDLSFDELSEDLSFDELSEIGAEFISDITDEQQRMLEEQMETLDMMETADPHMSKEDLDKLKLKHRNAEQKAILKAEMDYLKKTFEKIQSDMKSRASDFKPVSGGGAAFSAANYSSSVPAGSSAPSAAEIVSGTVDVEA